VDLAERTNSESGDINTKLRRKQDAMRELIVSKLDVQHALLALRGPGAILGDDCLRRVRRFAFPPPIILILTLHMALITPLLSLLAGTATWPSVRSPRPRSAR
jgi:hypothetical protein